MDNLVGQRLGNRYLIQAEIGRGGMGVVYRAFDTGNLQRTVAIKMPLTILLAEDNFLQRFLHEARQAASLHHANIVTIYDIGEEQGIPYIVMQHLEGKTLEQVLSERNFLTPGQTVKIVEQLAEALDYVHQRGMIHRDIKTANVMVSAEGKVTLMDFGLVRAGEATGMTRSHHIVGTPEFMSPEQALGRPTDARSDNYSLGIMVFKMLTGRAPYERDTHVATLVAHASATPPTLRSLRSDLNRPLEAVLNKSLAKTPDDRYQRAGQFAADLAEAASNRWPAGLKGAVAAEKRSPQPQERRSPSPRPVGRMSPPPATKVLRDLSASPATGTSRNLSAWLATKALGSLSAPLAVAGAAVLFVCVVLATFALARGLSPAEPPIVRNTPTSTAASTPRATDAPFPTALTPLPTTALTATPASGGDTPTATGATSTLAPTPTTAPPPTKTPTSSSSTFTPPSPGVTPTPLPAPLLAVPQDGADVSGDTLFVWDWAGHLAPDQAFEVRIWREGAEHLGAANPTTERKLQINVDEAPGVTSENQAAGDYWWTVAVVRVSPYARIGREAPPRRFRYTPPRDCTGGGCK